MLDVACGTGAASRAAARRAGANGSVTGVDLGEPTLSIARAQPVDDHAATIKWIQADATALPVDDGAFDVALCQQGLQFMPDKAAAVAEMHRALKADGRLGIATWTDVEHNPFNAVIGALERHVGAEAAQVLKSPFTLEAQELERVVTDAGFDDVRVFQESQDCTWAASPEEFAARTIASGPLAQAFAAAPEATRAAVAADTAETLGPHAVEGGIRMPMTSNLALARR